MPEKGGKRQKRMFMPTGRFIFVGLLANEVFCVIISGYLAKVTNLPLAARGAQTGSEEKTG
jgi:hypothetical protein